MLYLNDKLVNVTVFPDNTSQVWKISEELLTPIAKIRWDFKHESEVMHLMQLKQLLDSKNIESYLNIDYLPYGRQDKEISNESTFALRTFANLLNSMNFKWVSILDPHSEVAIKLIKNSHAIYNQDLLHAIVNTTQSDLFCYPDAGAVTKYTRVYNEFYIPYIYGTKIRDQLTGNITSYTLSGDPKGKRVLIIDDICDGGATFKILAKDLLAKGANNVVLFVTHGIFSKGTRTLFESGISRVFTKNGEVSIRYGSENI